MCVVCSATESRKVTVEADYQGETLTVSVAGDATPHSGSTYRYIVSTKHMTKVCALILLFQLVEHIFPFRTMIPIVQKFQCLQTKRIKRDASELQPWLRPILQTIFGRLVHHFSLPLILLPYTKPANTEERDRNPEHTVGSPEVRNI